MLFIVNELNDLSHDKKVCIEFREACENTYTYVTKGTDINGKPLTYNHTVDYNGYAFRVYDVRDITMFLNSWLKKIGRECERSTFKTFSDMVARYNHYVKNGGEPIIFDEAVISHGSIYRYK